MLTTVTAILDLKGYHRQASRIIMFAIPPKKIKHFYSHQQEDIISSAQSISLLSLHN